MMEYFQFLHVTCFLNKRVTYEKWFTFKWT